MMHFMAIKCHRMYWKCIEYWGYIVRAVIITDALVISWYICNLKYKKVYFIIISLFIYQNGEKLTSEAGQADDQAHFHDLQILPNQVESGDLAL